MGCFSEIFGSSEWNELIGVGFSFIRGVLTYVGHQGSVCLLLATDMLSTVVRQKVVPLFEYMSCIIRPLGRFPRFRRG
jgi:hypothetical protein